MDEIDLDQLIYSVKKDCAKIAKDYHKNIKLKWYDEDSRPIFRDIGKAIAKIIGEK